MTNHYVKGQCQISQNNMYIIPSHGAYERDGTDQVTVEREALRENNCQQAYPVLGHGLPTGEMDNAGTSDQHQPNPEELQTFTMFSRNCKAFRRG